MANRRSKSTQRKMRKIALVICEGESEMAYLNLLKQWFHSPIKVIPHIEGTKISPDLVNNRIDEHKISDDDEIYPFIMYDMDVPEINEKLCLCNAELLGSNPCFEIWLLLHTKDFTQSLGTNAVINELMKSASVWYHYQKSKFSETQKKFLKENTEIAITRAKNLEEFKNPSSTIYKLIELLNN